jgi:hypothetical protein
VLQSNTLESTNGLPGSAVEGDIFNLEPAFAAMQLELNAYLFYHPVTVRIAILMAASMVRPIRMGRSSAAILCRFALGCGADLTVAPWPGSDQ